MYNYKQTLNNPKAVQCWVCCYNNDVLARLLMSNFTFLQISLKTSSIQILGLLRGQRFGYFLTPHTVCAGTHYISLVFMVMMRVKHKWSCPFWQGQFLGSFNLAPRGLHSSTGHLSMMMMRKMRMTMMITMKMTMLMTMEMAMLMDSVWRATATRRITWEKMRGRSCLQEPVFGHWANTNAWLRPWRLQDSLLRF